MLASLIAVVLHEGAHAVVALLQGAAPVFYPFQVDIPGPRSSAEGIATATGPLF